MAVFVSDAVEKLKGYARNQNLDDSRAISVIDSAFSFVGNQITIPGYQREFKFDYLADQPSYALPEDFIEPISLRFEDDLLNKGGDFQWRPLDFLFKRIKVIGPRTRLYSHDFTGGNKLLWVLAKNSVAALLIDSFDINNSTNWTASNDATNIETDAAIKKEGAGSLRFTINTALSGFNRATLSSVTSQLDLRNYIDKGIFKVWAYLPTISNLTSISFRWGSSSTNYYLRVVTSQEDGTPFQVGWNKLSFAWKDATIVNSPDAFQINFFQFDYDYTDDFTGGSNFRLDHLRLEIPDSMILTYHTAYKGKNSANNFIYKFSSLTDKFLFDESAIDILEMIALYAAILLNPQLVLDNRAVSESYLDFLSLLRKRYPRKRTMNLMAEPRTSQTSWE